MIEAVVAAAVLAVVVLGVLKGLDTASRSSGREKGRAVAAALTEQDQERLRSFRAVDLADYDEERTIMVNGAPYKIVSRGDWIRDSTGGTASCNNTGAEADYMRVTTTTTSGLLNSPIPPITMSSLVAPPAGAFGINQGSLGVQVNDRDGEPVTNVPVTIAGPASDTNNTNAAGCAIFASIPVGSYTASVSAIGSVDHEGNSPGSVTGTVTNGTVSVATVEFDQAASVPVTFDTEPRSGTPVSVPAFGTQLSASNAKVLSGTFPGLRTFGVFEGVRVPGLTATGLFPFLDGYGLFGGGCPRADPTRYISDYYDDFPSAFIQTDPGVASPAAVVRLPSINLRVRYNSADPPATRLTTAKILVTSTSTDCDETWRFTAAVDPQGWMLAPALPFGDYQICASIQRPPTSTSYRQATISNVRNRFPQGIKSPAATSPVIDIPSGGTSGECF